MRIGSRPAAEGAAPRAIEEDQPAGGVGLKQDLDEQVEPAAQAHLSLD
jgi:hypothetical protein